MAELEAFRGEKDEFFASHPQSPLTPEQKRNFCGQDYFPENPTNPYCTYNDHWSCPLTPFENRLKVAIRSGEKIFRHP